MRRIIFIIFLTSLIFITGCWDKVEVDQRLFVSSIGIDLNKGGGKDRFIVTFEYPNINAIGKNATENKKTYVVSTASSSIFQAGRQFSTEVPFPLYYKHLKVLILGDELLNEEKLVREVVDELNRDTKINKKLQIVVADGKAKDILESNTKHNQTSDGVIYTALKDNKFTSRFSSQTLTDMISDFDFSDVTITPKISIKGDGFKIAGGCIMKNYKHLAWIDERENKVICIINGKVNAESLDIIYKDSIVTYTITNAKSNKNISIDDKIRADISIKIEGYLQGYIMGENNIVYNNEVLKDMEKAIETDVKNEIEKVLDLIQNTYNVDVIGIGEHLSKFHFKEWHQLKKDWDKIFPSVEINTTVDVKIRRTGLTK